MHTVDTRFSFRSSMVTLQHILASVVQCSIPIAISNGSVVIVVFNEKLNNPEVSIPA